MGRVNEMIADLATVDGIQSVLVCSRDGVVLEGVTGNRGVDMSALGASLSAAIDSSEILGSELSIGSASQITIQYKEGAVVLRLLGKSAVLATVAEPTANLGNLSYQVKKRTPAFVF